MTDRVLELLRARPDLAERAAFPFNFDIGRAYHVEEVHLASGASLEAIAGDDTGGTYFLCGGASVLHASSEGYASLLAESVGEALEMLVRLPAWCEDVSFGLDEEGLLAAVREGDAEAREEFAPDLDAQRAELIRGLGLPERPLVELNALAEAATRRTDPDHVLLNSEELRAYQLEECYRPPLREIVLAPGRQVLDRIRSGDATAHAEAVQDPVLRTGVLLAARSDPHDTDLPLVRHLLEHEDPGARTAGPDGLPPESPFTWIELARRQGRVEHARAALIRMLDEAGPAREPLRRIGRALERLGDHAQAARARSYLGSHPDAS